MLLNLELPLSLEMYIDYCQGRTNDVYYYLVYLNLDLCPNEHFSVMLGLYVNCM